MTISIDSVELKWVLTLETIFMIQTLVLEAGSLVAKRIAIDLLSSWFRPGSESPFWTPCFLSLRFLLRFGQGEHSRLLFTRSLQVSACEIVVSPSFVVFQLDLRNGLYSALLQPKAFQIFRNQMNGI